MGPSPKTPNIFLKTARKPPSVVHLLNYLGVFFFVRLGACVCGCGGRGRRAAFQGSLLWKETLARLWVRRRELTGTAPVCGRACDFLCAFFWGGEKRKRGAKKTELLRNGRSNIGAPVSS